MISHKEAQALEEAIKRIQDIENMVGKPHYDLRNTQEFKVNLRVDNALEHAKFKPDPKNQGGWICSEQTYRAMKKNIFALDDDLIEFADNYKCESCSEIIDRQFWHFCPHCGESFKT